MKIFFLFLVAFFSCIFSFAGNSDEKENARQLLNASPVKFIENKGQMIDMGGNPVPFVLFKADAPGLSTFITEQGLTYIFIEKNKEEKGSEKEFEGEGEQKWARVDMFLKGASIKKENIVKESASKNFFQYFFPHCPDGIKDVSSYEKITIKEIYPGIDWKIYNSEKTGFKYDFVVHPGADPNQIEMIYSSLNKLNLNSEGNLEIKTKFGTLTENAPVSFLNEKEIKTEFIKTANEKNDKGGYDTHINFHLTSYLLPLTSDLTIDPKLVWSTFYGGNIYDGPFSMSIDASGNVFVAGYTNSVNIPLQNAGTYYQGTNAGTYYAAFILKFDNAGALLWATYYGGSNAGIGDVAQFVKTDNSGNIFVTGYTTGTILPTQNAGTFFQAASGGASDLFILKFDNAGNRLWATYYGGSGDEQGTSIATDNSGNVFISGYTNSTNFPVQNSGTFFQGTNQGGNDAFILKFDNAGNRLWATYCGGSGSEQCYSIATDNTGNLFSTGRTSSINFPTQNNGTFFQAVNAGAGDAYVMKFGNTGNLLWSTYYGGSQNEEGTTVAADNTGNIFITGTTGSNNFPLQNSGTFFQGSYGGGFNDIFILKFDNAGNRLWATYYGGNDNEQSFDSYDNIAIDKCGTVNISFETLSTNMLTQTPCDGGYYDNTFNGGTNWGDIFIARFSNAGNLLWGTYLGGNGEDFRCPMVVDNSGNLFVTGEWDSLAFGFNPVTYPVTNPGGGTYYDPSFNGEHDGFMVKFTGSCGALVAQNQTICSGQTATLTASGGGNYSWSTGQTTSSITVSPTITSTYTLFSSGVCADTVVDSVYVGSLLSASVTNSSPVCTGQIVMLTASGGTNYSWSTGQTTSSITVTATGSATYTADISNASGCSVTAITTVTVNPTPTANAGSNVTICPGDNVTLTGNGNGTYVWNPSGQTTSSIVVSPTTNSTYTFSVTNSCGTKDTTVSITISNSISASISGNTNLCSGQSTTLTASGGSSFSWNTGQTSAVITVTPTSNVTYSVTVHSGSCKDSTSININVTQTPTATISPSTTICSGQPVTLNASGGNNYSWSTSATSSTITVSPTSNATYSVIVSNGSCADSASATVTVNQTPIAFSSNYTLCSGVTATMNAGMGGTSYSWSTGQTTSSIVDAPTTNTTYTVIISNGICSDTGYHNATVVTVNTNVSPGTATICSGQSVTLNANGGANYSWSNGSTSSSIIVAPTSSINYSVIATSWFCKDSASVTVTVNPSPNPSITGNTALCLGDAVTLTASGGGNYSWSTSASTSSIIVSPASTTAYTVTASNGNCSSTATITINVSPPPVASATSATICSGQGAILTANGGGNYLWSNGSSSSSIIISPTSSSNYSVVVSIGNCSDTANATVIVNPNPTATAYSDTTITQGQSVTLTASGGGTYSWTNGMSGSSDIVSPPITTMYCVIVTNNNCTDTTCVTVTVEPLDCSLSITGELFFPNAFSPNNDGENETFGLYFTKYECIKTFFLRIYNRWGEKVFETEDPKEKWDGIYKAKKEESAVFAYYLKYELLDGRKDERKGNVSLVR